jgi:hypothetical protein
MVPTSTIYIYMGFKTIHTLWMGKWIHPPATLTLLVGEEFGELEHFMDHSDATNESRLIG